MRRGPVLAGVLALFVAMTGGRPPPPAYAQAQNAASLHHFDAGRKAFAAKQFEQALTEFKASLELQPSPNTRLYIGRCYKALGKIASAYTSFKLANREATDRLNATGEKRYRATRDAATAETADLELKVPRLTVTVPSDVPEGYAVTLDGADLPKAAWGTAIETDPGPHALGATGPRLVPVAEKFDLKEGQAKRIDLKPTRVPTAFLSVQLRSQPSGIAIEIDGKPVDAAAAAKRAEVDVGEHVVDAHAPGYADFTWRKALANDEVAEVPVELKPNLDRQQSRVEVAGGTPKWLFFVVAGASLATLGAGAFVTLGAKSKSDDEQKIDPLLRSPAERDEVKSQATLGTILLASGAILGAGAGILAFTTKWKSSEPTPSSGLSNVRPWAGRDSAGVSAAGSF